MVQATFMMALLLMTLGRPLTSPEQLRLQAVDVLPLPEARGDNGGDGVHQDAPGQHAGEGLLDVKGYLAELPLQVAEVALDASDALLPLFLVVKVYYPKTPLSQL